MFNVRARTRTRAITVTALPVALLLLLGSFVLVAPTAQAAPVFAAQAVPLVSGVPQQGSALTVIAGAYSAQPTSFDYQWYADGAPVGTSVAIYQPTADDLGTTITVDVTAHHADDPDVTTTSAATSRVLPGGTVTAWGDTSYDQATIPASLTGETVTDVSAGAYHSLALTSDGRVIAWGAARDADLGQAAVPDSLTGKNVTAIAAGGDWSMALTDDGKVTAWGYAIDDHIAVPASLDEKTVIAISAGGSASLALTSDGQVTAWGFGDAAVVPDSLTGKTVVAISAGNGFDLALTSDGHVIGWGYNEDGETNIPAGLTGQTVTAIAAGSYHGLALTSDGRVVGWGEDFEGDTMAPASLAGKTVVAVGAAFRHSVALSSDGRVTAWGGDFVGQTDVPASLAGQSVTSIATTNTGSHTLAITPRLTALGVPLVSGVPQVGSALTAIAGAYTQQPEGFDYQWYADGDPVGTSSPIYRPSTADVGEAISVDVTAHHSGDPDVTTSSAATDTVAPGGQITGWGHNDDGQSTVPDTLLGQTTVATSAGGYSSLALSADGTVTAWGGHPHGETDVPDTLDDETVVAVGAGWYHYLAVTDDGRVTAWGLDNYGQATVPASLDGKTAIATAGGDAYSLALTDDGQVTAWGDGGSGQTTVPTSLDGKTVVAISAGHSHALALTSDGQVTAWGNDYFGQAEVPASLDGRTVVAVSAGGSFSMALTDDGRLTFWGRPFTDPAVPVSLADKTVVAVGSGNLHAAVLTSDGQVTAWGDNSLGQTAVPDSLIGERVTSLSVGVNHALVISANAALVADPPSVTGTTEVGQTLTAQPGAVTPEPDTTSYQWLADDAPVAGATDATFALTPDQLGQQITVRLTAAKAGYTDGVATSDPVGPVTTGAFSAGPDPVITGTAQVGQTLTAQPGTATPAPDSLGYQWLADGTPIPGATASTLDLTADEAGAQVTVTVTASKAGYADAAATSPAVGPVTNATFTAGPAPVITGTAQVGQTLAADPGTITPTPDTITYQWLADDTPISGATASTLGLTADEAGAQITVTVIASGLGYDPASATSLPLGPVATDRAPSVTLRAASSALREGQSTRLSWTSSDAASLRATGGWQGPQPSGGSARVRPSRIGATVYRIQATNHNGSVTAQVAIRVTRPATHLAVRIRGGASSPHLGGSRARVTTRGLARGEAYTIRVGGQSVAGGTAHGSVVRRTVVLPDLGRDHRLPITVTGSVLDRTGSARIRLLTPIKRLPLRLSVTRVRASDPITATVTGLSPREQVTVRYDGLRISPSGARAGRAGTYRITFGAGMAWGTKTVRVTGLTPQRGATATVTVVRRCTDGTHVCP